MRAVIILTVFLAAFTYTQANVDWLDIWSKAGTLEELVNKSLMQFAETLKKGDPNTNIPSFDPLRLDIFQLLLNNPLASADLTATNLLVEGVPYFTPYHIVVSIMTMHFELGIRFPRLFASTGFTGNAEVLGVMPIYGTGSLSAELLDFDVMIQFNIGVDPVTKFVFLEQMHVVPGLGGATFNFLGLFDNDPLSAIAAAILNENLLPLINDHQAAIDGVIGPAAQGFANTFLEGKTINDIISIIASGQKV